MSDSKTSSEEENHDAILQGSDLYNLCNDDINAQESAMAILGAADENKCTYSEGYLPRQALFSCRTCKLMSNNQHPLLCYACSINCHKNHTIAELYTKRNTRCDCPTHSCKIETLVVKGNSKNKYNQNSQKELYCKCQTMFPDPNDPIVDSMYQCVVCEDWYHTRHLFTSSNVDVDEKSKEVYFCNSEIENKLSNECSEIICCYCVEKYDFLTDSQHLCLRWFGKRVCYSVVTFFRGIKNKSALIFMSYM